MSANALDQVVALCKRRGFIFPGSAIYGGLANSWDLGPLGIELARNVKEQWWRALVHQRDDMEGLDSSIILNRKVWKYSGHEGTFNDPLVDNKLTKKRYRLDHLLRSLLEGQRVALLNAIADAAKTESWLDRDIEYRNLLNWLALPEFEEWEPGRDLKFRDILPVVQSIGGITPESLKIAADPKHWGLTEMKIVLAFVEKPRFASRVLNASKTPDPATGEPGDWTEPRLFNLMFDTHAGAIKDEENKVYLRPETAQGIFINFKHVQETMRRKLPFGVAQIGKSFRNEITPGNFIFRTREFEQMEMEFFVMPPPYGPGEKTDDDWHREWVEQRYQWYIDLGISPERLRKREQSKEELAHYAKATTDIEYLYPGSLGFAEIEGIANRTDYDLTAHSRDAQNEGGRERLKLPAVNPDAVENLTYFDAETKRHIVPYVIEPASGVARIMLAFLCEAFHIEPTQDIPEAEAKKVSDLLASFAKSAGKSDNLAADEKQAIQALADDITSGGPAAFPRIATLLDLPGAAKVELGKKLKNAVERLLESHYRTVLKLDYRLAPVKIAVFPLKKNEPNIVDMARKLRRTLSKHWYTVYDDTGAIGKLYRRQDEIGTPFCITVDFQTLDDNTVTVRDRDTMEQVRVHIEHGNGERSLREYLLQHLSGH